MSFVSWPFVSFFFKDNQDKGYTLSGLIGWICNSFIYFLLASIFGLNAIVLGISVVIWLGINYYFYLKDQSLFKTLNVQQLLKINLGFVFIFLILYFILARNPRLYEIERFMDFGFIKALFNSTALPPKDSWMIGKYINYYYFGHFIAYTILSLTKVAPEQGFYLVNIWVFSNICINLYRLSHDYFLQLKQNKAWAKLAGILSIFLFQFAGTFYLLKWLKATVLDYTNSLGKPTFWYADLARSIKGTITEPPLFSLVEATSHAHVFGFMNGIIVLSILFALWRDNLELNLKNIYLYLLSFFLGIAYLTNSWNLFTLTILSGLVILSKYKVKLNLEFIKLFLINFVILIIVILPWQIYFKNPLGGIGLVREISSFKEFFLFWGAFLILGLISMFYMRKERKHDFFISIFFSCLLFLLLMETIYFKDVMSQGEWYKANTVFKLTSELWLWFSSILGVGCAYIMLKSKKMAVVVLLILAALTIYPIKTLQYFKNSRAYTGLQNPLKWFEEKYPEDYDAYKFLKDGNYKGNIAEAAGDSYTDSNFFSTLLGMPTIIGWSGHEWTWRGTNEGLDQRRADALELYTGYDIKKASSVIKKYNIKYIIIGSSEKRIYSSNIKTSKLLSLGEVIFQNPSTVVIATQIN